VAADVPALRIIQAGIFRASAPSTGLLCTRRYL
jgi:hypothetical protein